MEQNEEQKKNLKRYHIGKTLAKMGAALLAYLWIKDKMCQCQNSVKNTATADDVLVIDNGNEADYFAENEQSYRYGHILYLPTDVTNVFIETDNRYIVHNIMPQEGEFADGTRIRIFGNLSVMQNTDGAYGNEPEEYSFSHSIYSDISQNNRGRISFDATDINGCELLCFKKKWWFIV